IALAEIDPLDSAGPPPHGSHLLLVEADAQTVPGAEEDVVVSVGDGIVWIAGLPSAAIRSESNKRLYSARSAATQLIESSF
ncbi:MAG: hypothetical protein P8X50_09210, partial [Maritimibacter sp.]